MSYEDEITRREPPLAGDEIAQVIGALERQRAIFAWKCGNLDAAGMRATHAPSSMSLGGLVKHLAAVEDTHFARLLLDVEPGPPWDAVDWDADPDWDWHSAADDAPGQIYELWADAVGRSRAVVAKALADGDLDQLGAFRNPGGQQPSLRRILLDLIEEYARHIGHADLIRETVDGLTGEDLPD
jgi:hypothetical protein